MASRGRGFDSPGRLIFVLIFFFVRLVDDVFVHGVGELCEIRVVFWPIWNVLNLCHCNLAWCECGRNGGRVV